MNAANSSRRSFLFSTSGVLGTALFSGVSWSQVVSAAHHAAAMGASAGAPKLQVLTEAEVTELDAISSMIIPSGKTPGAHEARVVYFADYALGGFLAPAAPGFREGLAHFGKDFAASHGGKTFSAASPAERVAYLKTIESTQFFQNTRMLTVLGFLTSPKYGGNAEGIGWKAIGFEDQHVFSPPFGYYDKNYTGFVPYEPQKKHS